MNYIQRLGERAKDAREELVTAPSGKKNDALYEMAHIFRRCAPKIIEANEKDLALISASGVSDDVIERVRIDEKRIDELADMFEKLCVLPDPVGEIVGGEVGEYGMRIRRERAPVGVVGMIYEARAGIAAEAAALCIKSGNAVILRGGREAFNTDSFLVSLMRKAVATSGFPEDIIQLVEDSDKGTVIDMMRANDCIDLLIPRGSRQLVNAVVKQASVPVLETGDDGCHIYVDESADMNMALDIIKSASDSPRGRVRTILVHRDCAEELLPKVEAEVDRKLRGCEMTAVILGGAAPADEDTYMGARADSGVLAVRVVDGIGDAIRHIQQFGSGACECIITERSFAADEFQHRVDAAAVFVNCSPAFNSGDGLGIGTDMGVSVQKLHTRGPIGLEDLTAVRWLINGNGEKPIY